MKRKLKTTVLALGVLSYGMFLISIYGVGMIVNSFKPQPRPY